MTDRTLFRANEALLKSAKAVFGGIITDAYVTTYSYGESITNDDLKRLEKECKHCSAKRTFNFDGMNGIVLKFAGGNHVFMSTSEWVTIERVNIDNYVKA